MVRGNARKVKQTVPGPKVSFAFKSFLGNIKFVSNWRLISPHRIKDSSSDVITCGVDMVMIFKQSDDRNCKQWKHDPNVEPQMKADPWYLQVNCGM